MPETRPQLPLARPPIEEVIRFIDESKDRRSAGLRWGIEPIAKTLGIAPSTYYAAKTRPPSARAVRDAELAPVLEFDESLRYVSASARATLGQRAEANHDRSRETSKAEGR